VKTFTIRIEKNPDVDAFKRLKRVIKTGVPDVRPDELLCDSMDSALKVLSKSKFELFGGILTFKPESLAALAKALDKDQANVQRDARALEALGLIKLAVEKDGDRTRLRPTALYNKIIFDFGTQTRRASGH
jgi:predicted transcriptional regulator